jgi:hypothetical protein
MDQAGASPQSRGYGLNYQAHYSGQLEMMLKKLCVASSKRSTLYWSASLIGLFPLGLGGRP